MQVPLGSARATSINNKSRRHEQYQPHSFFFTSHTYHLTRITLNQSVHHTSDRFTLASSLITPQTHKQHKTAQPCQTHSYASLTPHSRTNIKIPLKIPQSNKPPAHLHRAPDRNNRLSLHHRPLNRDNLPAQPDPDVEQHHYQHDPPIAHHRIRARSRHAGSRPGRGKVQVRGQQHYHPAPVGSGDARRGYQREGGEHSCRQRRRGEEQSWAQRHAQRERRVLEQRAGWDVELQVRRRRGQGDGYCCECHVDCRVEWKS